MPDAPEEHLHGPLDALSEDARGTLEAVLEEHAAVLDSTAYARLYHAAALETAADRLDAIALAANYMSIGSASQPIIHPAVAEARQARATAASILGRLVPAPTSGRMTASERGRAAASARWSGHAGRQPRRAKGGV